MRSLPFFVLSLTAFFPLRAGAVSVELPAAERVEQIAAMLSAQPCGIGKPITDRKAWEFAATQPAFRDTVSQAARELAVPTPDATDALFLEYSQNGNRTRYQKPFGERLKRLTIFTEAECLENKGRFLPAIETEARAICAERTWVMPAHDEHLNNFYGRTIEVDLGAAMRSWSLATADVWLGDRVNAETRRLIRTEIKRRVLDPFSASEHAANLASRMWWMHGENNWNAVCHAGVVGSALALVESPKERAFYVAAAEKNLEHYFAGFPSDGYCSEGVGYWNFGFGYYTALAEAVRGATGGKLEWLAGDKVRAVALYARRIAIQPGLYPAFADCPVDASPARWLCNVLDRRLNLGIPGWRASQIHDEGAMLFLTGAVMDCGVGGMEPTGDTSANASDYPPRDYFQNAGILLVRPMTNAPDAIAAALKGGNNNENHNHNDIGSYVVGLHGKAVIVDPGPEVYTKRTFGPHRYDSDVLNSFGHSVPMVAGKLQVAGAKARAENVQTHFTDERDTFSMEMKSAYDVGALQDLTRTFEYSRTAGGTLEVTDSVRFDSPQTFGTAIVTFGTWTQTQPGVLRISDGGETLQVELSATGGEIEVKADEIREDVQAKRTPTRIGINFTNPLASGSIRVKITPVK